MRNLIKYEWRKQRTARMIILTCLIAFIASFVIGTILNSDKIMGLSILILFFTSIFGVLYVGIESIVVLNRDLRTKQSYMLWMVPKSTWEILGAKCVSAVLQMLFVFVLFFATFAVTVTFTMAQSGLLGKLLKNVTTLFSELMQVNVNWLEIFCGVLILFLIWVSVIMTGFLSVILSRTVFLKSRFAGAISVILFFVINFLISKLYGLVFQFRDFTVTSFWIQTPWLDYLFYLLVCVVLFGISGWIAERKLSI